jgi:hypothetical protein
LALAGVVRGMTVKRLFGLGMLIRLKAFSSP